jgi:hypothetical protein
VGSASLYQFQPFLDITERKRTKREMDHLRPLLISGLSILKRFELNRNAAILIERPLATASDEASLPAKWALYIFASIPAL